MTIILVIVLVIVGIVIFYPRYQDANNELEKVVQLSSDEADAIYESTMDLLFPEFLMALLGGGIIGIIVWFMERDMEYTLRYTGGSFSAILAFFLGWNLYLIGTFLLPVIILVGLLILMVFIVLLAIYGEDVVNFFTDRL